MAAGTPEDEANTSGSRDIVCAVNEATPLITSVDDPILYRTISRRSDASQSPKDDSGVEASSSDAPGSTRKKSKAEIYGTLAVLLLGVFVSNTDQSLVLATYNTISSDFDDLNSGSWLMSGFILAQCVVQPLYGKLSDIYGRKACLQASYILFVLGTAGAGLGQTLGQVIAARVVQGAGSAGMGSMVSIIITDLVPMREVAAMRSYVNVLHTTGRSFGGVIGGYITQTLSWRWAFLIQVPPTVLAIILVQWRLHLPDRGDAQQSKWEKLKRIDFVGAFFLCLTIFSACFVLEVGGQKIAWGSPVIIAIEAIGAIASIAFTISANIVAEPIFPMRLVTQYVVVTNYLIVVLQCIMQMSLMVTVAIYFQITENATTASAGGYLIPAFVGNTIGGLLSGYWIKRTGRYKAPTLLAPISSLVCVLLCFFTWNGHTNIWESFYTLPGGLAMGLISSAAFVALAAGVGEADIAVAGSGVYLSMNVGAIAGVSVGSAVFQTSLRSGLEDALAGMPSRAEIIRQSLTDIEFVQQASDQLRALIVPCFVKSFHSVNVLGIVCASASLVISTISKEHRIMTK